MARRVAPSGAGASPGADASGPPVRLGSLTRHPVVAARPPRHYPAPARRPFATRPPSARSVEHRHRRDAPRSPRGPGPHPRGCGSRAASAFGAGPCARGGALRRTSAVTSTRAASSRATPSSSASTRSPLLDTYRREVSERGPDGHRAAGRPGQRCRRRPPAPQRAPRMDRVGARGGRRARGARVHRAARGQPCSRAGVLGTDRGAGGAGRRRQRRSGRRRRPTPNRSRRARTGAGTAFDGVELFLALEEDSWMRVTVDGTVVFEQVAAQGETLPFPGEESRHRPVRQRRRRPGRAQRRGPRHPRPPRLGRRGRVHPRRAERGLSSVDADATTTTPVAVPPTAGGPATSAPPADRGRRCHLGGHRDARLRPQRGRLRPARRPVPPRGRRRSSTTRPTADVVLVNTCTFIAPAKQESIDTVLEACDLKGDDGAARAVLVVGCMAERYPDELAEAIPEADAIVGFDGYGRLPQLVDDVLAGRPYERVTAKRRRPSRRPRDAVCRCCRSPRSTGAPVAAEPIAVAGARPEPGARARRLRAAARGRAADRRPARPRRTTSTASPPPARASRSAVTTAGRGPTSSSPPAATGSAPSAPSRRSAAGSGRVRSTSWSPRRRWLVEQGARELVLVSENTTSWGKDLDGGRDGQAAMVETLADVDGLERLRLMYLQPAELTVPLLETVAGHPKVASYFDLSLQHVSGPVVRRMARSGDHARFGALIDRIRGLDPRRGVPLQLHPRLPRRDRAGRAGPRGLPRRAAARLGRAVRLLARRTARPPPPCPTRSMRTRRPSGSSGSPRSRNASPTTRRAGSSAATSTSPSRSSTSRTTAHSS